MVTIGEIEPVVEFNKLQHHLNRLRLIRRTETSVIRPPEDPPNTLIRQVRADRVLAVVQLPVKLLLLGQQHHTKRVLLIARLRTGVNCTLYVGPDVRRVIAIQIYDGL